MACPHVLELACTVRVFEFGNVFIGQNSAVLHYVSQKEPMFVQSEDHIEMTGVSSITDYSQMQYTEKTFGHTNIIAGSEKSRSHRALS